MQAIQLTIEEIKTILPARAPDVHKGTLGKVMVVAGSRGMSGAAILASRAVMRSGAGLTTLFTPGTICDLIDVQNIEVMTRPLPETTTGAISRSALNYVLPLIKNYDTLLLGPGLSANKSTLSFTRDILEFISHNKSQIRTILDADGLKGLKKLVRPLKKPIIITPHFGELAAIAGEKIKTIKDRPYYYARKIADRYNVIVVLKSNITYIVRPGSQTYFVNNNGNPGMATAGAGDVLAGIIAGTWSSNKITALQAAAVSPFIHATAGNIAATKRSIDGIIASDILEEIPAALKFIKGF